MLACRTRDRPRRSPGLALPAVAGYTDAAAFVALLGVFVSNMSGTTTRLAVELGRAHWHRAIPFVIVVTGFVAGAFAGQLWLSFHPRALRSLLVAEAVLLSALPRLGSSSARTGEVTSHGLGRVVLGAAVTSQVGIGALALASVALLALSWLGPIRTQGEGGTRRFSG